jgi:transposase-like protein
MINERGGRNYDREFKENAVALVRSGRTQVQVAHDLGVHRKTLSHWIKLANTGQVLSEPKDIAEETPEQRELRRLRHELAYVTQQRDILKKAVGILSAEMPPSSSR